MKVVFTEVAQEQYNEIIFYLNASFGNQNAKQFSELFKKS